MLELMSSHVNIMQKCQLLESLQLSLQDYMLSATSHTRKIAKRPSIRINQAIKIINNSTIRRQIDWRISYVVQNEIVYAHCGSILCSQEIELLN